MSEPLLVWEPCGCVFHVELQMSLPCSLHTGQTEAQRKADDEQHAWEGAAMNGWIDKGDA